MKQEIQNLQEAIEENIQAIKTKSEADVKCRKARNKLRIAREQLHFKTQDLLEQAELNRE